MDYYNLMNDFVKVEANKVEKSYNFTVCEKNIDYSLIAIRRPFWEILIGFF